MEKIAIRGIQSDIEWCLKWSYIDIMGIAEVTSEQRLQEYYDSLFSFH